MPMRIALIAPPFIPVPPTTYGGTELFLALLAEGLKSRGFSVVMYTNGESTVQVERRWLYPHSEWPIQDATAAFLREMNHSVWAVHDAAADCDVIHVNSTAALAQCRWASQPFVHTIHHPHEPAMSEFYASYPDAHHVAISDFQKSKERVANIRTIHHGLDLGKYRLQEQKQDYALFLGRVAPQKGTHLAIRAAKLAGVPLKIAGEVQPMFQAYFDAEIAPHVDGKSVEFVGHADLAAKNELFGGARAFLFPIEWEEPFGLVMIEAMACGTPVLAFPRGSVGEVVKEGVSGHICGTPEEMAARLRDLKLPARQVRGYVEKNFSLEGMVDQYAELYRELAQGSAGAKRGREERIA